MSGRLSTKTKEKFAQTFERLVEFDKARMDLMFDDEPDVTPQERERREILLLGQRGDFNFHRWLVQELSRINGRWNMDGSPGWGKLSKHERSFIEDVANLADLETQDFAESSLAVAERYFEIEEQANAKLNRVLKILRG